MLKFSDFVFHVLLLLQNFEITLKRYLYFWNEYKKHYSTTFHFDPKAPQYFYIFS